MEGGTHPLAGMDPAAARAFVSDDPERLQRLLAQGWERLVEALTTLERSEPEHVRKTLDALGGVVRPESVRVLAAFRDRTQVKRLRKAAGAAIGLLTSRGLDVERILHPIAVWSTRPEPDPRRYAWLSTPDSQWLQALLLPLSGPGSRRHALELFIHSAQGVVDVALIENLSREEFREYGELPKRAAPGAEPMAWDTRVLIPIDRARGRYHRARALHEAAGRPLPGPLPLWHAFVPAPDPATPDSLVASCFPEAVSAARMRLEELLRESPQLLNEPEFIPWFGLGREILEGKAAELQESMRSRLDVPAWVRQGEARRAALAAVEELFGAEKRSVARQALEDLAYIFLMTDRVEAGYRAIAAYLALDQAERKPGDHPLLSGLITSLLAHRLSASGEADASETLESERNADEPAGWTRRSGLLLPAGPVRRPESAAPAAKEEPP